MKQSFLVKKNKADNDSNIFLFGKNRSEIDTESNENKSEKR